MNRKLIIILSMVLIVLVLTILPVSAQKKVTVSFWYPHTGLYGDVIRSLVDMFNKESATVSVKATYVPVTAGTQVSERLMAAIAGGNPPDTAYFDRFTVGSWAVRGSLTDLTDYAKALGVTSDMYYSFAWEEANYEGRLYALPHDTDDRALYYNKKVFRDAGLDPEKPPKTIAELDAMAEKITKKDARGRLERIGLIPWLNQGWLYGWGWVFGGEFYDPKTRKVTANDPKIVAALEWMVSYAKKYDVAVIDSFSAAFGSEAMDPFHVGQLGTVIDGDWKLALIDKYAPDLEFGVVPFPIPPGGKLSTWAGGWSIVVPKGAKNPKEAFEWASWFCGPKGQLLYCVATAHIPTIKEAAQDPAFWEGYHKVFMELLPYARYRPVIPEGDLLWVELASATDQARHLVKPSKQLLDEATAKVNKALEKWYK